MKALTTRILGLATGILASFGLDPAETVKKFENRQLEQLMEKQIPDVEARLEADLDFDAAKRNPDLSRQWIRSAIYLLIKESLNLPQGGNLVADLLRDHYDDQIVFDVQRHFPSLESPTRALEMIVESLTDQIF
jgi:hypothetical protein